MGKTWKSKTISPFIYPLYPEEAGQLRCAIDLQKFFQYECARGHTGELTIERETWCEGQQVNLEQVTVGVHRGVVETPTLLSTHVGLPGKMAYMEVAIGADAPIFDRPLFENNFGLLRRPGYGSVAITDTPKFSDTRIIEQIREIGSYCMAHTGIGVDRDRGYGDFFLLINPYEQDLMVRLNSSAGKQITVRMGSRSVDNVSLEPLLGDKTWTAVSLTAKQRILVYDVKAPIDNPLLPISLDHLDAFRGEQALRPASLSRFAKHHTKRALRVLGAVD